MLRAMIQAAVKWMSNGLNITTFKLCLYRRPADLKSADLQKDPVIATWKQLKLVYGVTLPVHSDDDEG